MESLRLGAVEDVYSSRRLRKDKVRRFKMSEFLMQFNLIKETIKMSKKDIWISIGVLFVAMMFVVLYIKLYMIIHALI